jgi:hypothetical protein
MLCRKGGSQVAKCRGVAVEVESRLFMMDGPKAAKDMSFNEKLSRHPRNWHRTSCSRA